jgi:phage baseplate assembly protein W
MAEVETPHLAFPFARGPNGKPALVDQDTPAHVMACENVILRCPSGFRQDRPEFGVPYPEYDTVVDPDVIATALMRFEPRSDVTASTVRDYTDRATAIVTVEVQAQGT